jgi:fatty acid/phospholipid biosynthesis enzyme
MGPGARGTVRAFLYTSISFSAIPVGATKIIKIMKTHPYKNTQRIHCRLAKQLMRTHEQPGDSLAERKESVEVFIELWKIGTGTRAR